MARAYAAVAVRVARMQAVRWLMVLTLGASGAAVASVPRTVEGIPFEASAAVQASQSHASLTIGQLNMRDMYEIPSHSLEPDDNAVRG